MSKGLLLFTDFHAHLFSEFAKPSVTNYTDRFNTQMSVLETMLKVAQKEQLGIVFGGDLFHRRGAVDVRVFKAVYKLFADYCDNIPFIYLLRGNHDSFDNSMGSPSSLDTFAYLPHTQVISKPTYKQEDIAGTTYTLYFMPYGEDIDQMKAELKAMGEHQGSPETSLLFAHLGIDGAKQGKSVHRLASAFTPSDMYPEQYKFVYLGHYHARQVIDGHANMYYGGSTMQLSFNDEGQEKGYDTYTGTDLEHTFVPVTTPKFVTLDHWDEEAAKATANDYVRLQVSETTAKQVLATDNAPQMTNVRVEAQAEVNTKARMDIKSDSSPEEITKKYTDEYYPELKDTALKVLGELK